LSITCYCGDGTWTGTGSKGIGKDIKGRIKQKWGQLTDDDLTQINGRRDQLEGKIQQRYGLAKVSCAKTSTIGWTPNREPNLRNQPAKFGNRKAP
jgi:uncharacterized protein YjbJ (UPF0337 family)